MPSLSIQTPGSRLSLRSEQLILKLPEESEARPTSIPLHEIDRVCLSPKVGISSDAIAVLIKRQIPIDFLDWAGRYLGGFHPPAPPRGATRLEQYRVHQSPEISLLLARRLILSQILNARRILQRLQQRYPDTPSERAMDALKVSATRAMAASDFPSLRGIEGSSTKLFMEHWTRFLPSEFPFGKRSTRPPLNATNAVISYLSSLIYGELLAACHTSGLDPALGLLHVPTDDRFSLPLDLMEPFRPSIIFPLTLRLLNQKILRPEHFLPKNPGIWLSPDGRKLLHRQYEKLMIREFLSQHLDHRTTLRTQIQPAPLIFKASLSDPSRFLPFQLNGTSALDVSS